MHEKINVQNEQFAYEDGLPFQVIEIFLDPGVDPDIADRLMHHWHSEMEICYCMYDGSHHYIDGTEYLSKDGKVIIVNSGSIHHFKLDPFTEKKPIQIAILLLVREEYINEKFPAVQGIHFQSDGNTDPAIGPLMKKLSHYAINDDGISSKLSADCPMAQQKAHYRHIDHPLTEWEKAEMEGLVLQILAILFRDRQSSQKRTNKAGKAGNLNKMKDIIAYIEEHYDQPITQEQVARQFFYSSSYFSSFFRKNMQVTFSKYLSDYRAKKARFDLLETDDSIYQVAINHGFSDSRRFILAFQSLYGVTPLQYRKASKKKKKGS
ncbi:MAG: helix-turn-helix transcriptional regulator [Faecalicoccus sp.]|nr:helix-turn-helix transcriptional regulator [Faecalicoccus sp.]